MAQWSMAIGIVLVLAVLAALIGPLFRRRGGGESTDAASARAGSIGFLGAVATFIAAVAALTGIGGALSALLSDQVEVDLPLMPFWPTLPDSVTVTPGDAELHQPEITRAHGWVSGLSATARWMLAGGALGQAVAIVAVCLLVRSLCRAALRPEPFTLTLSKAGRRASIAVLLGGVLGQVLQGMGQSMASVQSLSERGYGYPEHALGEASVEGLFPRAGASVQIEFLPIVVALVIAVFTQVVARGLELQRDRAKLERETEGLV